MMFYFYTYGLGVCDSLNNEEVKSVQTNHLLKLRFNVRQRASQITSHFRFCFRVVMMLFFFFFYEHTNKGKIKIPKCMY